MKRAFTSPILRKVPGRYLKYVAPPRPVPELPGECVPDCAPAGVARGSEASAVGVRVAAERDRCAQRELSRGSRAPTR